MAILNAFLTTLILTAALPPALAQGDPTQMSNTPPYIRGNFYLFNGASVQVGAGDPRILERPEGPATIIISRGADCYVASYARSSAGGKVNGRIPNPFQAELQPPGSQQAPASQSQPQPPQPLAYRPQTPDALGNSPEVMVMPASAKTKVKVMPSVPLSKPFGIRRGITVTVKMGAKEYRATLDQDPPGPPSEYAGLNLFLVKQGAESVLKLEYDTPARESWQR